MNVRFNVEGILMLLGLVAGSVVFCVILFRLRGRSASRRPSPESVRRAAERREQRAPAPQEPMVRVFRLLLAIPLAPIYFFVWVLASIENIVAAAVHLVVATVGAVFGLVMAVTGTSPGREWRRAGLEFGHFMKHVYEAGRRAVVYLGVGGLLDRIERGIDDARQPHVASSAPRNPHGPDPVFPFEDRYRVESHLKAGGSTARLFVVRRLQKSRAVGDRLVLKYFDMGLGSRLEEVIRESRGMSVAKEMGIVLDHRLEDDFFYYVMPYYEGETLTRAAARFHRHLRTGEALEPDAVETVLDWTGDVLRILDGYHRRGVIHKDVKPDNILVTDDGVRLVDLGLLTPVESALTLTTHGTEYFRDPEMVKLAVAGKRVRDVDAARFDIYSTGAVVYYLLEGSFPACGPLSRFSRPVPMALSWITSRAMAEGDKRYPSIAAMRTDLEAARRLAGSSGGYGAVPVAKLPSFRGFGDAPPPPPPLPPLPRARGSAAATYPPPAPETDREAIPVLAEAADEGGHRPRRRRRFGGIAAGLGCFLLVLIGLAGGAGLLLRNVEGTSSAYSSSYGSNSGLEVPDRRTIPLALRDVEAVRTQLTGDVKSFIEQLRKDFPELRAAPPVLIAGHLKLPAAVVSLIHDPTLLKEIGGSGVLPRRRDLHDRMTMTLAADNRVLRSLPEAMQQISSAVEVEVPLMLVWLEPSSLRLRSVDIHLFYVDTYETTQLTW